MRVTSSSSRASARSILGSERARSVDVCGCFEVHQGGILGAGGSLAADREYWLALDDGTMWRLRLAKDGSSNSAGFARLRGCEIRAKSPCRTGRRRLSCHIWL